MRDLRHIALGKTTLGGRRLRRRTAALVVWGGALVLPVVALPDHGVAGGGEVAFVEGFDDLPLMPALAQEADGVTVFESPYGRIVESWASGRTTRRDVLGFYAATLPQLGWTRTGETVFRREGEILMLDITEDADAVTVRFQISPTG